MRPPTIVPESRIAELHEFRRQKWSGFEFQRFLCVWLRVERAMSPKEIAEILGWHVNTVRFTQSDFIKHGAVALVEGKRGGRRRQLLTPEGEKVFLEPFREKAERGNILIVNEIIEALEKHLGHKVHKTTVYRMLHRQQWRKIIPRPHHPKQNKEAIEDFKKGASLTG